uniref:Reverse transcriptase domain-containing protein n=1 Tax=Tanacetum cinerariifolium TaxID=118510 RepID=A0A6L2M7K1_TANCI|nr:reverse transcriptase domain-containing protein [Tanacetum cinerariifolium]
MSTHSGPSPIAPTSVVRNTQEKLKAVKARLNFEEVSQHSESGTPSKSRDIRKRLGSERIRIVSESPETRHGRSVSPRKRDPERKTMFKRLEKGVFHMLRRQGKEKRKQCRRTLKVKVKKAEIDIEDDDLSQPWGCKGSTESHENLKFMHGITNSELIKCLHYKISRSVDEMMRVTTSFFRGEVVAGNQERKSYFRHGNSRRLDIRKFSRKEILKSAKLTHVIKEIKKNSGKDQPKTNKKEETSNKDKALEILMVQPWQRVARQRITQSFSPNPEISFPPLEKEEGTEGTMIIEAEIRGHFIHCMYMDGGSASKILYEHCFNRLRPEINIKWFWPPLSNRVQWRNHMTVGTNITAGEDWRRGTFNLDMDDFYDRGILTLKRTKIIPIECAVVLGPEGQPLAINQAIEERIKLAINPEYPEQTIMIGSTLTEEDLNKISDLLQRNLDVFAWKSADMTGVPRHIAEHRLNVQKGCPPVRQKKRGQAGDRNHAIQKEVKNLLMPFTKKSDFYWSEEAESAFKQIRKLIAKFPMLTAPEKKSSFSTWQQQKKPSSCANGSGAGLILTNPDGKEFTYALRFRFEATNNEAKYKFLIAGLRMAKQIGVKKPPGKCGFLISGQPVVKEEMDMWMTPIYEYLTEKTLPTEVNKTRVVRRKSQRFVMINGVPYMNSFLGLWLQCIGSLQANYVLRDIHGGSCSMHASTRSVVAKALLTKYYWPTMHKDARTLIKACQDCQVHRPVQRNPQQKLTLITSLWSFYKWEIDIYGPFSEGPGKVKFLIVAIDYFTKWIKAKPVVTITGNQCKKLCIRQRFASVKHPQANGLVERENQSLGEGIKARLDARSKNWMEEISHALWAHRTMIKSSNGHTPFSLTYGTRAVILAEIDMPTLRTSAVDMVQNDEALEINLDLLEERREHPAIREAKSKAKMEKYYNSKVRSTSFKPGDLVYHSNDASRVEERGKLGLKWEGPYKVTEALGKGAYKLRDRDEQQLSRT